MQKKFYLFLIFICVGFFAISSISSCKTKEGCESTKNYKAKTDKSGQLSTKRGSSNLFSKKQRKKMKQ